MAAIVSLRDVVEEMDQWSDEATAYINPKTDRSIHRLASDLRGMRHQCQI